MRKPLGFFADRVQQRIELLPRIEVRLVQGDDDRPPLLQQSAERLQFAVGDVAVENEDDEIGAVRDFLRHFLARFAARLVQSRRVDQENAGCFDFRPLLHRGPLRFPVQRAHRKFLFADERIQQR